MHRRKRVLITGAAGLVGGVLREALADNYTLSTLDIKHLAGDHLDADMTDFEKIFPMFEGKDIVIDLAAHAPSDTPWPQIHENNLPATYNVYEASLKAGVQRVIFASSNHVTGLYEEDKPYVDIVNGKYDGLDPKKIPLINTQMPIRPDGAYGIAKAFGEATGRFVSDRHGVSSICLRIGSLTRSGGPDGVRNFATLLTHRDLAQLVEKSIETKSEPQFNVFYGVSDNTWRFWDIGNAVDHIGYNPQDDAEKWR